MRTSKTCQAVRSPVVATRPVLPSIGDSFLATGYDEREHFGVKGPQAAVAHVLDVRPESGIKEGLNVLKEAAAIPRMVHDFLDSEAYLIVVL